VFVIRFCEFIPSQFEVKLAWYINLYFTKNSPPTRE
jgi:hypothetical protein